jgi:Hydrazine synthase alpha subunit middle domain
MSSLLRTAFLAGCFVLGTAEAQVTTPNPVMFVTQYPIPYDFASIGSVFGNHRANVSLAGRGGDLYIRYGNGTLRNLTREAGYGVAGVFQGAQSIVVRDPAVHWSGTRALFSMAIGAPTQQFVYTTEYFQIYEVTGFGVGQTVSITKVANQPADYNNIMPIYASDGSIIFASDRPRNGERHLYPQHDEYESTPTATGLWNLQPGTGTLKLLQHSPSGSFNPIVDSFGRVLFTRWDHLQRDQQNDSAGNEYGTFNFTSEAANSTATVDRSEVFPEPRIGVPGSNLEGMTINHFFPWQVNQDGTGEETLNHLGRHELHSYFNRSFNNDNNLVEFISAASGRFNPNPAFNFLQLHEDPTQAGRYYAVDAPEFYTQNSGQIIRLNAPPSANPAAIAVEYVTHPDTEGTTPSANHSGHYRNPLVLSNGTLIAAHTMTQGEAGNDGTRAAPIPRYLFRLRTLSTAGNGYQAANSTLTAGNGIVRHVQYWDPDVMVDYNGPMWEISPVEVRVRTAPPSTGASTAAPEQSAYARASVSESAFKQYLRDNNLGVVVMRDVTARDVLDRQQPFNLAVAGGGRMTPPNPVGTVYQIAHMQFFQGDQIRGIGGMADPTPGRRVIAQFQHDAAATAANMPNPGGPTASVPIAADGSVAAFVTAQRALSWQTTAANGSPVVRERFWITLQPGEVRACDGCHGVNQNNQAGQPASVQTSQAFIDLLGRWFAQGGGIFANGVE